jgi:hypothetical protein
VRSNALRTVPVCVQSTYRAHARACPCVGAQILALLALLQLGGSTVRSHGTVILQFLASLGRPSGYGVQRFDFQEESALLCRFLERNDRGALTACSARVYQQAATIHRTG